MGKHIVQLLQDIAHQIISSVQNVCDFVTCSHYFTSAFLASEICYHFPLTDRETDTEDMVKCDIWHLIWSQIKSLEEYN